MNMKNIVTNILVDKVVETPWVQRYKGTLLIVLTGVVAALSAIAPLVTDMDGWVAPAIAAIVTIGTALTNRFTQDGFTPSMVDRAVEGLPAHAAVEGAGSLYDHARRELAR